MSNTAGVDLEELRVPSVGESISEVVIGQWRKSEGDSVGRDEELVELESEKATFEAPAPVAGTLAKIVKPSGSSAEVGEVIAYIDPSGSGATTTAKMPDEATGETPGSEQGSSSPTPAESTDKRQTSNDSPRVMPSAGRELHERGLSAAEVTPTGPGNRLLKEDVQRHGSSAPSTPVPPAAAPTSPPPSASAGPVPAPPANRNNANREERKPMSPLRKTIASRLVSAQHNAALLTTFNEADLTEVKKLRAEHGEVFQKKHGVKLGFMAFFVKAVVEALKNCPELNASIDGDDLVYHHYYDIGIAIGTEKGLVVPILRDADRMGFAEIESTINDYGTRARANKLGIDEMMGGTFTISNGGVYGSLLSTPIVNPPQSGVLGMHSIQERPVAMNGQVVIRPMMYLALTYDHRVVDGREAVTFLREIKEAIEEPARILIEI